MGTGCGSAALLPEGPASPAAAPAVPAPMLVGGMAEGMFVDFIICESGGGCCCGHCIGCWGNLREREIESGGDYDTHTTEGAEVSGDSSILLHISTYMCVGELYICLCGHTHVQPNINVHIHTSAHTSRLSPV